MSFSPCVHANRVTYPCHGGVGQPITSKFKVSFALTQRVWYTYTHRCNHNIRNTVMVISNTHQKGLSVCCCCLSVRLSACLSVVVHLFVHLLSLSICLSISLSVSTKIPVLQIQAILLVLNTFQLCKDCLVCASFC